MEHYKIDKIFLISLVAISIVFVAVLFYPFLGVLIFSLALSVVFYPVYKFFNKKLTRDTRWLSALLTLILFIIIFCIPIFLIGSLVLDQSQDLYRFLSADGSTTEVVKGINKSLAKLIPPEINTDVKAFIIKTLSSFTSRISGIFSAALSTIFSLFLIFISMFYFLKDGSSLKDTVIEASPLPESDTTKIIQKMKNAINGVVKGYLLIAVVQGVLMSIGLAIFGVPHPALFGLLAGIASLIPTIGTALVSIPIILYLFSIGNGVAAFGMMAWSIALVGTVDNLLNPIVVGKSLNVHPLLILFAVLGGVVLLGPIGILIGPLSVSFLYAIVSTYKEK